jgi:predicted GTPase
LLDEPNRKVNHLNILVIGKTGAGKSSLIGEMLRYEKENNNTDINNNENNSSSNPKSGFFKPTTIGKPKYYESKTVPFLRFADTQGIEIAQKKVMSLME